MSKLGPGASKSRWNSGSLTLSRMMREKLVERNMNGMACHNIERLAGIRVL